MSAARRDLADLSASRRAVEQAVRDERALAQLRQVEAATRSRNIERRQEVRDARALAQLREIEAQAMGRNAERRAERRALGFVTPASPAESFVSARSATPVDLTFANQVMQNVIENPPEEVPELLPAVVIPIQRSPETVEAASSAILAEVEAETAFAQAMRDEAAYEQEMADQGKPVRRSNRARRAPQKYVPGAYRG